MLFHKVSESQCTIELFPFPQQWEIAMWIHWHKFSYLTDQLMRKLKLSPHKIKGAWLSMSMNDAKCQFHSQVICKNCMNWNAVTVTSYKGPWLQYPWIHSVEYRLFPLCIPFLMPQWTTQSPSLHWIFLGIIVTHKYDFYSKYAWFHTSRRKYTDISFWEQEGCYLCTAQN